MKKLIKISLIGITIIVVVFVGFVGYMKYQIHWKYLAEIDFAKDVLLLAIQEDEPNEKWIKSVRHHRYETESERSFYFFKIWFTEANIKERQLENCTMKHGVHKIENYIDFTLHYESESPSINCQIFNDSSGMKVFFAFPMNNCMFHPDYNDDGNIDKKDLKLTKKGIRN